jgi:toxin ParE1/3/4
VTKLRIIRRPAAIEDLVAHGEYYVEQGSPEAAVRFLGAADMAFEQLARRPGIGAPRRYRTPQLSGLRMWPIPGFEKHLVFYRQIEDGIEVVRVLHGARDLRHLFEKDE